MTRTYALKRLLEHGPMTPAEMVRCTCWTTKQVHSALIQLRKTGMVRRANYQSTGFSMYAYEAVV